MGFPTPQILATGAEWRGSALPWLPHTAAGLAEGLATGGYENKTTRLLSSPGAVCQRGKGFWLAEDPGLQEACVSSLQSSCPPSCFWTVCNRAQARHGNWPSPVALALNPWLTHEVNRVQPGRGFFLKTFSSHTETLLADPCPPPSLTFHFHAHLQALLEAAELAAVAVVLVDDAVLVAAAAVGQVLPHAPFEEAFATFTTDGPIVTACKEGSV